MAREEVEGQVREKLRVEREARSTGKHERVSGGDRRGIACAGAESHKPLH